MEMNHALSAFAALGHETRLNAFRLLVQAGQNGLAAGVLADRLDTKPNTLSAALSVLLNAGLVKNRREGRSIVYVADMDGLQGLMGYLMRDCCGGRPELCQPVLDEMACKAC